MDDTLFRNIKKLFDYELYEDVIILADILHTIHKNEGGGVLSPEQEFQLLLFEANAYYNGQRYRMAEPYFRQAIQLKKNMQKVRNNLPSILAAYPIFCDSEVKYRYAFCLNEIDQIRDALSVLGSIEHRFRSPKAKMLLAKLNHHNGLEPGAKLAYKDVLNDCHLSLSAIKSLLELGVNGIEVNSLIVNTSNSSNYVDWINNWIKGNDLIRNQKFDQAADAFLEINKNSKLRTNAHLLVSIGECFYFKGDYDNALYYLEQAHSNKPNLVNALMPLAVIYTKQGKLDNLENLTQPSLTLSDYTSENWFVHAQNLFVSSKYEKSAYFAQKAIYQNPRNAEAYLLKAKIFFELKKYTDALLYLRNAQSLAPYRFEVYKGLVNCYLASNRMRDAQTAAAHAVRICQQNPRSLVLLARTFLNDSTQKKKAKTFLTKALQGNECYFAAGSLLAEILQSEGNSAEALTLLKKLATVHQHFKIYLLLGEVLSSLKDMDGALENYTKALNLDPTNARALAGLAALGHNTKPVIKTEETNYGASTTNDEPVNDFQNQSFEMVELSPPALSEVESESETIWSDVDAEVNNH